MGDDESDGGSPLPAEGSQGRHAKWHEPMLPIEDGGASLEVAYRFSGPIPHPQVLAEYDRVVPGSAARIIDAFEKESGHRRSLDRADSRRATSGQWMALAVALAFLGVAAWLISAGHGVEGTILGSVDLVALVTAFIAGRRDEPTAIEP